MSSRPLQPTATPGIYRRGGRYVVVLRDRSGRQFKRSAKTLAEARMLKSTLTADITRGELQETRRMTFEQYAAEWMRTYGGRTTKGIREITMRRYRTVIEREAVPLLGKLQLADIEPRDIKRYAVEIANRGVSANTVRLYLAPLRALFATPVETLQAGPRLDKLDAQRRLLRYVFSVARTVTDCSYPAARRAPTSWRTGEVATQSSCSKMLARHARPAAAC